MPIDHGAEAYNTPNIALWLYAWTFFLLGSLVINGSDAIGLTRISGVPYRVYNLLMNMSSDLQGDDSEFGPWKSV